MRIGFLLTSGSATITHHDGRLVQIRHQMSALRELGHEVVELSPWNSSEAGRLEVLHVVEGGLGNPVGLWSRPKVPRIVVAPFLDTNSAMWKYRALALLGSRSNHLVTPQGALRRQASVFDGVIARSRDEVRILRDGVGVPEGKVRIVLNGVNRPNEPVMTVEEARRFRESMGLPEDFAFHLGTYGQRRKNVVRLIKATEKAGVPLVIAGYRDPGRISDTVDDLAKRSRSVRILPELTNAQRTALYLTCRVFCLPSLYEGTGLAAMEAAVHGAPVVVTCRGGTPDYFTPHAELVDPFSVGQIAAGIRRQWDAPKSDALKEQLLVRYSWKSSAESLVQAYRSIGVAG